MDYISPNDPKFNEWVKNYADYIDVNFAALGLTLTQKTALIASVTRWKTDFTAYYEAQASAIAATQKKNASRAIVKSQVRELTKLIQANSNVTDDQRAALGITIPKESKTPTPVPDTRPMAVVENINRLEHIINYFDEITSRGRAKPAGVRGCEIWYKIGGEPPADASGLTYLTTDTGTPYIAHFKGDDGGKTVHYMLRWVNTRNEPGPWSETISVTISA
jgi:hypothetical protein